MGYFSHPVGVHLDHLGRGDLAFLGAQVVQAILVKTAGGRVEGDGDLFAGLVTGLFDGLQDQFDGFGIGFSAGAKPPSSPTPVE